MLKVTRDERSFIVESDDANAENAGLEDAIGMAAPQLANDFEATPIDGDGMLRWRVQREDWQSLLEALEAMQMEGAADPAELDEAIEQIEKATKEPM